MLVGVLAAVVVGGALQRVAGMGLGLVAAPVLALLLGPVVGVTLSNAAAVVTALLVLGAMWRHVDWSRFARLAPLLVTGTLVGALTVRSADPAWLDVLIGASVLLALGVMLLLRPQARAEGRRVGWGAGLAAGFMNTTSGVAAPAMTVYALATRWEQRSFAATLQPVFLLANSTSLVAKASLGTVSGSNALPWWVWAGVGAAAFLGVGLGGPVARRMPLTAARAVAVTIALCGGVLALGRGLLAL